MQAAALIMVPNGSRIFHGPHTRFPALPGRLVFRDLSSETASSASFLMDPLDRRHRRRIQATK